MNLLKKKILVTGADGFISVAESDASLGKVINIGSNYEISIGALVGLIAEIMQAKIEIQIEQLRLRPQKSEVERLWADNSLAKKLLGWEPDYAEYVGLKRGLTETMDWFNGGNLNKYKSGVYNI